jgi:hypothetical protein
MRQGQVMVARVPQRTISEVAATRVALIAERKGMSQADVFQVLIWQGHGRKSLAKIELRRELIVRCQD